jgi:UDP-glucose 4-epimerase
MPTILLTGATGYIGSHTWLALQQAGFDVVGVDDHSNSSPHVLARLAELGGRTPVFERASVCDAAAVEGLFQRHRIDAAVHFAAFKAVGESAARPLAYFANNLGALVTVCQAMQRHGVRRFVFSSSATVYGDPQALPIRETAALQVTNPYGRTKLMGEQILADLGASDPAWQTAVLRYFNPVGAHESGRIGEDPRGTPNNLMPYVAQVAVGRRPFLQVFGNDYPTPDGTGVRDYIHVTDLAEGHVAAVRTLLDRPGSLTVNLGTGRGHSVLEVVAAYAAASGREVPHRIVPRRPGDVAACWADPSLARELLGWSARHDLARMCTDSWRWQSMNPNGFEP